MVLRWMSKTLIHEGVTDNIDSRLGETQQRWQID
jgi:hypothetical protein